MKVDTDAMAKALNELRDTKPLFDAIDTLRRLNLHTHKIPFPQLIVVGDQSSGKSSVLESIAQISLPVGKGVCTRFPIELVFRRSEQRRLRMRIIPGRMQENDQAAMTRMKNYGERKIDPNNIDLSAEILAASAIIGVSTENNAEDDSQIRFSDDVLQIEHYGPSLVDLTLIDLPGLFVSASKQQTAADRERVKQIAQEYVRDSRSIVLLVTQKTEDYANNEAPNVIEESAKKRTMGILTNLDVNIDPDGAMRLLERKIEADCQLGWHFLINRSGEQRAENLAFEKRDELEKQQFQAKYPKLPPTKWGVTELRKRLRDELLKRIEARLPEIIFGIEEASEARKAELKSVLPARSTELAQRMYLARQAQHFFNLARAATYPTYSDYTEFFGNYDYGGMRDVTGPNIEVAGKRRLQSTVRAMNRIFSAAIWKYGRSTPIDDPERSQDWNVQHPELSDILGDGDGDNGSGTPKPSFLPQSVRRKYIPEQKSRPISVRDYEMELQDRHKGWIGKEPRSEVSFDFYSAVFDKQTEKWDELAKIHLDSVWQATIDFIDQALRFNMPDQVRQGVSSLIIKPRLAALRQSARDRLQELVRCHRMDSHVFLDTYPDFIKVPNPSPTTADSLLGWLQGMVHNLESISANSAENIFNLLAVGNTTELLNYLKRVIGDESIHRVLEQLLTPRLPQPVLDIMQLALSTSTPESGSSSSPQVHVSPESENSRRIINHTERYYDASVFSFVGYVNALIIQGIILKGMRDTIFTFDIGEGLDAKVVQRVAGETQDLSERRTALENDISKLESVLEVLESSRFYR
ncbi:P-loop containing nucleoside triphosphate hydrolase protein [Aspergillus karnatakaensis]|uniref:dynamin family protein n=1 Tax=Aspergillus karnatakaensis TaxID=1810916 RepID=UPI003CCCFDC7